MILRLEQISRLPQRKHIVKKLDESILYEAEVEKVFKANIEFEHGKVDIITDEINQTIINKNNVQIGKISSKVFVTKKVLFLPVGYEYNEVIYEGKTYQMFESGLGKNQHFFSIYNEDETVAVIHKDDRVVNYLNTYTLYAEDKQEMEVALICTMFLEATAFCDRTAGIGYKVDDTPYYTAQKELRDRYDSNFIPKIKLKDGVR